MIRRIFTTLVLLLTIHSIIYSQIKSDTLSYHFETPKRGIQHFIAPVALIGVGGFMLRKDGFLNKTGIQSLRNQYAPTYCSDIDVIGEWAALPAFYLMKMFDVPSRSGYLRGSTNYAASLVLAAGMAEVSKRVTNVWRPDYSDNRSLPSGHTTIAFAGAHFIHKEFGGHSPYISAAAYAVATGVGVNRVLSNRHYASDVFVGAGLGIFATEMGYLLSDLVFGKWGYEKQRIYQFRERRERPSFARVKLGYAMANKSLSYAPEYATIGNGFNMGGEAALFFNEHWGAGIEGIISSYKMKITPHARGSYVSSVPELGSSTLLANLYYNCWLSDRFALIGKVGAGIHSTTSQRIMSDFESQIFLSDPSVSWAQTMGITARWHVSGLIALDMMADYYHAKPNYNGHSPNLHNLALSGGFTLFIR